MSASVPIAELDEDRVVEQVFAVARKQRRRTKSGDPYLALELVDPTGRIDARVWTDVELLDPRFAEGDAIRVLGRVERFRDRLQLEVRSLEKADVDPGTLVQSSTRAGSRVASMIDAGSPGSLSQRVGTGGCSPAAAQAATVVTDASSS